MMTNKTSKTRYMKKFIATLVLALMFVAAPAAFAQTADTPADTSGDFSATITVDAENVDQLTDQIEGIAEEFGDIDPAEYAGVGMAVGAIVIIIILVLAYIVGAIVMWIVTLVHVAKGKDEDKTTWIILLVVFFIFNFAFIATWIVTLVYHFNVRRPERRAKRMAEANPQPVAAQPQPAAEATQPTETQE